MFRTGGCKWVATRFSVDFSLELTVNDTKKKIHSLWWVERRLQIPLKLLHFWKRLTWYLKLLWNIFTKQPHSSQLTFVKMVCCDPDKISTGEYIVAGMELLQVPKGTTYCYRWLQNEQFRSDLIRFELALSTHKLQETKKRKTVRFHCWVENVTSLCGRQD